MSQYPPPGSGPPPPYYGSPVNSWPVPPNPSNPYPVLNQSPYPYFVPGTMMVPVPIPPIPAPDANQQRPPTYITNYIYHGETSNQFPVDHYGGFEWVTTTATTANDLSGRAFVGGHEGWDGSPLWIIRSWHNGDLIPGKLSIRHSAASVVYDGKEIPVQNIEVLCARPEILRWLPASNGGVPPGAVSGGRTSTGEPLYVGRASYQLSVTPGKVHPSHNSCYIGFAGVEVALKVYDVLCRI